MSRKKEYMITIGKLNKLRVVKEVDFGVYLDGGEFGEILLPKNSVPDGCKVDDILEVFIYLDSEDIIIATTNKPYGMVDQFVFMKVLEVNKVGAFLDWGLQKDLLVPFGEQKNRMIVGNWYVVFIYLDALTKRIVASSKLDKFFGQKPITYEEGEEVDLMIYDHSQIGYKAIINDNNSGLLFETDVFRPLKTGDRINGFIKKIREDGKIDLCLHEPGYEKVEGVSQIIYDCIKAEGGFLPVTNHSSPNVIYELFGVSKKTYKMAVGALYKKRLITIESDGIKIKEEKK